MPSAPLYADENVEAFLIEYLRDEGLSVEYAPELGFKGRDDAFHLQEARRRRRVLLTRDCDFLNDAKFPFQDLGEIAIVVLRTPSHSGDPMRLGFTLVAIFDHIVPSGRTGLAGLKIELEGRRIIFHARIAGRVMHDEIDISKPSADRMLFEDPD
jgi:predicted nuclease of predicted toxin-antitoxin system